MRLVERLIIAHLGCETDADSFIRLSLWG